VYLFVYIHCVQVDAQRRQLENEIRRAAFTAAHLDELPDTVSTYHSVGKAYVSCTMYTPYH
jgi:hypothetical protein